MRARKAIIVLTLILLIQLPVFAFKMGRHHHSDYSKPVGMDLSSLELEDGIYTGSADGFRPDLTVEVTVSGGEVTAIEIVDHNEIGRQYWQRPMDLIPAVIIEEEQTNVDAVSGATATSKAIMAAVENALNNS
ncbi:MAG: FMN-binding protein [Spirochaetales bacterium]|nr:FMN-binding protein [Spirochaetales bacterium]